MSVSKPLGTTSTRLPGFKPARSSQQPASRILGRTWPRRKTANDYDLVAYKRGGMKVLVQKHLARKAVNIELAVRMPHDHIIVDVKVRAVTILILASDITRSFAGKAGRAPSITVEAPARPGIESRRTAHLLAGLISGHFRPQEPFPHGIVHPFRISGTEAGRASLSKQFMAFLCLSLFWPEPLYWSSYSDAVAMPPARFCRHGRPSKTKTVGKNAMARSFLPHLSKGRCSRLVVCEWTAATETGFCATGPTAFLYRKHSSLKSFQSFSPGNARRGTTQAILGRR